MQAPPAEAPVAPPFPKTGSPEEPPSARPESGSNTLLGAARPDREGGLPAQTFAIRDASVAREAPDENALLLLLAPGRGARSFHGGTSLHLRSLCGGGCAPFWDQSDVYL